MRRHIPTIMISAALIIFILYSSTASVSAQCSAVSFAFQSNPVSPVTNPDRPVVGDFNRDGKPDAAWNNFNADCIYSCTYSFNSEKRMCFKTLVCSGMDCLDEVTITIHFNVVGMKNLYME